jgi:hypothetical protein
LSQSALHPTIPWLTPQAHWRYFSSIRKLKLETDFLFASLFPFSLSFFIFRVSFSSEVDKGEGKKDYPSILSLPFLLPLFI